MRLILVVLILFVSKISFSQDVNKHLYKMLHKYKEMTSSIKCEEKTDLSKCFRVTNLGDSINSKRFAIYKFEFSFVDDDEYDLVIINNGKIEIFDMRDISFIINRILEIKKENDGINDQVFVRIVKGLIETDKMNKRRSISRIIIKVIDGNTFYIDINDFNIKSSKTGEIN